MKGWNRRWKITSRYATEPIQYAPKIKRLFDQLTTREKGKCKD